MHQQAAAADCNRPVCQAKRGGKVDESPERTGQCQQYDQRPVDRRSPAPSRGHAKLTHREIAVPRKHGKSEGIHENSMVQATLQMFKSAINHSEGDRGDYEGEAVMRMAVALKPLADRSDL